MVENVGVNNVTPCAKYQVPDRYFFQRGCVLQTDAETNLIQDWSGMPGWFFSWPGIFTGENRHRLFFHG
jgi:hypothetical protein